MNKVSGYIKRKSMLYVTGVEYGDFTMNHILGCSHGCKYPCYAFMLKKRFGKISTYNEWISPLLVSNTLEILDREIPRLKSKIKSVHLCFTSDPFMYGYDEIAEMSLAAISKLNSAGIKCSILTKGILPACLSDFSVGNEYGITLVSLDDNFQKRMEPGAAPNKKRIEALNKLHDSGCKTWVSIEPYPTPNIIEQDIDILLNNIYFVDKIIFGRTNYSKEVSMYKNHLSFYNSQARIVIDYCKRKKIECHIKDKTMSL